MGFHCPGRRKPLHGHEEMDLAFRCKRTASVKHNCIRRTATGTSLRWLTTTTPLPVAVGHPTWEICGEMAALKVRTGDGDVELSSASVEEEDDGSNPDWDGDVEVGSAEVEEEDGGESMMGCFRRVIETPLWDCLTSKMFSRCEQEVQSEILPDCMYDPFAEFFIFLLKKDGDK